MQKPMGPWSYGLSASKKTPNTEHRTLNAEFRFSNATLGVDSEC